MQIIMHADRKHVCALGGAAQAVSHCGGSMQGDPSAVLYRQGHANEIQTEACVSQHDAL